MLHALLGQIAALSRVSDATADRSNPDAARMMPEGTDFGEMMEQVGQGAVALRVPEESLPPLPGADRAEVTVADTAPDAPVVPSVDTLPEAPRTQSGTAVFVPPESDPGFDGDPIELSGVAAPTISRRPARGMDDPPGPAVRNVAPLQPILFHAVPQELPKQKAPDPGLTSGSLPVYTRSVPVATADPAPVPFPVTSPGFGTGFQGLGTLPAEPPRLPWIVPSLPLADAVPLPDRLQAPAMPSPESRPAPMPPDVALQPVALGLATPALPSPPTAPFGSTLAVENPAPSLAAPILQTGPAIAAPLVAGLAPPAELPPGHFAPTHIPAPAPAPAPASALAPALTPERPSGFVSGTNHNTDIRGRGPVPNQKAAAPAPQLVAEPPSASRHSAEIPSARSTPSASPTPQGVVPAVPPAAGPVASRLQSADPATPPEEPELVSLSPTRMASDAQGAARALPDAVPSRPELPRHIALQIAEAVQRGPNRPVEIALSPAELGRVRISLQTGEGVVMIHISADRPETLDLMRRHADLLDQDFHEIGYGEAQFSFARGEQGAGGGHGPRADIGLQSELEPEAVAPAAPSRPAPAPLITDRVDIRI